MVFATIVPRPLESTAVEAMTELSLGQAAEDARARRLDPARQWPAAATVALFLAAPALWNGFPLVFDDVGGYIDGFITGLPANGRAAIFGAYLTLGIPFNFWPMVLIQSALMAWLLVLMLKAHGFRNRPGLTLSLGLGLGTLTSLPWYASQIMPDIFAPAGIIALYLLAFRLRTLAWHARLLLGLVIAFGMAGHMAIFGVAVGLCVTLIGWRALALKWPVERPRLAYPVGATAFGVLLALAVNWLVIGQFGFTPGGSNFLFGRLIQTGIAAQYLADNCPNPTLRLCAYRDSLPSQGDDWLWSGDSSPLYKLGGWDRFEEEAARIVKDSLARYPIAHLQAAAAGTIEQLVRVKSGDIPGPWTWHLHGVLKTHAPHVYGDFAAARQQQKAFEFFSMVNIVHVPLALLATAMLPLLAVFAWRGKLSRTAGSFAAFVLIALLGNAFVCGALSNPHDRYQSRVVPLAVLALALAALAASRRREHGGVLAGEHLDSLRLRPPNTIA